MIYSMVRVWKNVPTFNSIQGLIILYIGVSMWMERNRAKDDTIGLILASMMDSGSIIKSMVSDNTFGQMEGFTKVVEVHKYLGFWEDNNMHGKGMYQWKDGRKYEGDYHYDQKHGFGIYTWYCLK